MYKNIIIRISTYLKFSISTEKLSFSPILSSFMLVQFCFLEGFVLEWILF